MTNYKRYDEDFKQSLATLYQTGKSQAEISRDHGIFHSALSN